MGAIQTNAKPTRCMRCGREHRTGMNVVRPLCPPCWMAREAAKRGSTSCAFAPDTQQEHLEEQWLAYSDLITECVMPRGRRPIMKIGDLSPDERWLYAVGYMDSLSRERGFYAYFSGFHRRDGQHVLEGLNRLDVPAHRALYQDAFDAYQELVDNGFDGDPYGDDPLFDFWVSYGELDDLVEPIALAAWQGGLIVEAERFDRIERRRSLFGA